MESDLGFEHRHDSYDFSVLDRFAVLDPDTSIPKKGLLTRYGRKQWQQWREEMERRKKKYRSIDDPWEVL